ncbi:MAG: NADPH-dependent F420 reductase, partial [Chloroflexi bacterium]|nr:NADPH-dependent F420 reductase [Chloroflexota bacterium]
AQNADLIVLTVPHTAQPASLPALNDLVKGKVVVSTGVPMEFAGGRASIVALPEGSAAEQAQALLPDARVIGAFQNLGAAKLWKDGSSLDQDVIVCGDEDEAKQTVMKLSEEIAGVRAVDGGVLANARYVEGITALLVSVNRNYKKTTGVRIAGL